MHRNKVYLIKFYKRLLLELAFVLSLSVICRLCLCSSCTTSYCRCSINGGSSHSVISFCSEKCLNNIMIANFSNCCTISAATVAVLVIAQKQQFPLKSALNQIFAFNIITLSLRKS